MLKVIQGGPKVGIQYDQITTFIPHMNITNELNQLGITVWGGLSSDGVMGSLFFDTTVDSNNYLNIMCKMLVPQLTTRADFT